MTFKQFAAGIFYAPAHALSGLSTLTLGATYLDKEGEEKTFSGLFGLAVDAVKWVANLALDATKFVARGVSNFITNHHRAIAVAFWSSLAIAGAAALTVAFWPAALTAVTSFGINGVSIASLVGTGYLAQVGAVAGVAAAATSAAVYVSAAFINTINAIGSLFSKRSSNSSSNPRGAAEPDAGADAGASAGSGQQRRQNPFGPLHNTPQNSNSSNASSGSSADSSHEDLGYGAPLYQPNPELTAAADDVPEQPRQALGC